MVTEEAFQDWLQSELNKREWDQSELAKRGDITAAQISRIMSGTRNPGPDACIAIAKALDLPPTLVFQKAGLLPPEPEETADLKEALHLFNQLSPERRKYILTTMRALASGTPAPAPKASR